MGLDIVTAINGYGAGSEAFTTIFLRQVAARQLREAAVFTAAPNNQWDTQAVVNYDDRALQQNFTPQEVRQLGAGQVRVKIVNPDTVEGLIRLDPTAQIYLYGSRGINSKAVLALNDARNASSG